MTEKFSQRRTLTIEHDQKIYIGGSCYVDHILCCLVIPINRQMQSDGVSDVYFDVALILSKWKGIIT